MQLNFVRNSKVELYIAQLKAEKDLSHHSWIEKCKLQGETFIPPLVDLTKANDAKLFEDRMLSVHQAHIAYQIAIRAYVV